MTPRRKIAGGIYLVVDPTPGIDKVLPKIDQALKGGLDVLQVWNKWNNNQDKFQFINKLCITAHKREIPVLINDDWELLKNTDLDGVHFDTPPADLDRIRQAVARPFICGITCGNNLERIQWAVEQKLDYISFCSMFPSPSAGVCEIVSRETVMQARQLTSMPVFLAGGITLDNVHELTCTGMNGIALISAIMKSNDPQQTTKAFKQKLTTFQSNNHETHSDR